MQEGFIGTEVENSFCCCYDLCLNVAGYVLNFPSYDEDRNIHILLLTIIKKCVHLC